MVQPENIDSGHSNTKLGAGSGRRHRNLDHLQIDYLVVGERQESGKKLARDFLPLAVVRG
jgi:hypothetical protein